MIIDLIAGFKIHNMITYVATKQLTIRKSHTHKKSNNILVASVT